MLIGVDSSGQTIGQKVAESTRRAIGHLLGQFEPPPPITVDYVDVPDSDRQVIVLDAPLRSDLVPFTFKQRPFQRLESTTVPMAKGRYEQLLLRQMQSRHRWEVMLAEGVELSDLDAEQIRRTVRLGANAGRLPESAIQDDPEDALRSEVSYTNNLCTKGYPSAKKINGPNRPAISQQ